MKKNQNSILLFAFVQILFILNASSQVNIGINDPVMPWMKIYGSTPEAANLETFTSFPNLQASGMADVTVPLYTLAYEGVKIPVYLKYNTSGIRVNQLPTAVGQNWMLNAGGYIHRTVMGKMDETGWTNMNDTEAQYFDTINVHKMIGNYIANLKDNSADIFHFYLPGGASGHFFFERGSKNNLIINSSVPVKVKPTWNNNTIEKFLITDSYGNIFYFLYQEVTTQKHTDEDGNWSFENLTEATTAWALEKIVLLTDEEITFEYELINYNTKSRQYRYVYQNSTSCVAAGAKAGFTDIKHDIEYSPLVKKIKSPIEEINFTYEVDTNNPLNIYPAKLESIQIEYKESNGWHKRIDLTIGQYDDSNRTKLEKVKIFGSNNDAPMYYYFSYYENSSDAIPEYGSHAQDVFGFQNSNAQVHMTPKCSVYPYTEHRYPYQQEANREVDECRIINGALRQITYPTGGGIIYEYEANVIEDLDKNKFYGPGIRVSQITLFDEVNNNTLSQTFQYSDMVSLPYIHTKGNYFNFIETVTAGGGAIEKVVFLSQPNYSSFENGGNINTFFYRNITTINHFEGKSYRIADKYNSYQEGLTFVPELRERRFFNTSNKEIKNETYKSERDDDNYENWFVKGSPKVECYVVDYALSGGGALKSNADKKNCFTNCNRGITPGTDSDCITDWLQECSTFPMDVPSVYWIAMNPDNGGGGGTFHFDDNPNIDWPGDIPPGGYTGGGRNFAQNHHIEHAKFDMVHSRIKNHQKSTTEYFYIEGQPTQSITRIEKTHFNELGLLHETELRDSDKLYETRKVKYPGDYPSLNWIDLLNNAHAIALPIDVRTYNNSKLVSGKQIKYNSFGQVVSTYNFESAVNDIPFNPSFPLTFELNTSIEYDPDSNKPIRIEERDNSFTHIVWGYENQHPVSKIITNTDQLDIPTIESLELAEIDNYNEVKNSIIDLKNELSSLINSPDNMVSLFTYKPLVGLTSETSPAGITTYYEYDHHGRLQGILDHDGMYLQKYQYHYRNSTPPTSESITCQPPDPPGSDCISTGYNFEVSLADLVSGNVFKATFLLTDSQIPINRYYIIADGDLWGQLQEMISCLNEQQSIGFIDMYVNDLSEDSVVICFTAGEEGQGIDDIDLDFFELPSGGYSILEHEKWCRD